MIQGLLGRKLGMTQIFDKDGNIVPVTLVKTGPCTVLELKDSEGRIKVGFEPVKESRLNKPLSGYFKKIGVQPMRVIQEFLAPAENKSENGELKVGQEIRADVFKAGDFVDVTGASIGKGFAGGVKRWHWAGGPGGHGSMHHRRVGSIGMSSDPSRVFKGKHMPGHMGAKKATVQGLRIMDVDVENSVILVKGAVPGHKNGLVCVRLSKKRQWLSLDEKKAAVAVKKNPMKQSKAKAKGKGK